MEPWAMQAEDIAALRDAGYNELQLLNIVLLCGYRHYITRVADGTGIELDDVLQTEASIVEAYSYDPGRPGPVRRALDRSADAPPIERTTGPWIATVGENELEEGSRATLDRWRNRLGFVPNFLPAMSLNPAALNAVGAQVEATLFGPDELGARRQDLIAATVGRTNRSRYLEAAFSAVAPVRTDDESALETFVVKLTADQARLGSADLEALRARGYRDHDLVDLVLEVAALNSLTRLVEGLGVPCDPPWIRREVAS